MLRLSLISLACVTGACVHAVEANFQATISVYGDPLSPPTVAYNIPAGENLSFYTSRELADDVVLSGPNRVLAGISFEYYANYAATAGLTFRMYEREESGVPGELIYSLPLDILNGGGLVNISFNYDVANALPQRFFYSVQFAGVQSSQVAGMIIPDRTATTGFSANQLLEKRGNNWLPISLNAQPANRLGLIKDGNTLTLIIVDAPNTVVVVETSAGLGDTWIPVAQVQTDSQGDAEYQQEVGAEGQVFFRTVGL
jgi:hypothetical protein